jgi:hypothetical protein
MKQWTALKQTDLPALNERLRGANLPELRLDSHTTEGDDSEDIE